MGYRVKDLRFRTSFGGRRVILKGDLNIKADVSYRDNVTVLRNLEFDNNQVTAGQRLVAIKINADYALDTKSSCSFSFTIIIFLNSLSLLPFHKPVFDQVLRFVITLEIKSNFS